MDLNGKTILVGRDPKTCKLMISVFENDEVIKTGVIGPANSVPNSVSRCIPTEDKAHCSIVVDQTGNMTLKNLKQQNITYVDDVAIASKAITTQSNVALGKDKFVVKVSDILNGAAKMIGAKPVMSPELAYSIDHLEKIWEDYQKSIKKANVKNRIPLVFTMSVSLISILSSIFSWPKEVTYISLAIVVTGILYLSYSMFCASDGTFKIKREFEKKYVCPKCGYSLGYQSYTVLTINKQCSHCKCKFKWKGMKK